MKFHKRTSIGNSNTLIKLSIKIVIVFFLFSILLILLDQINFPAPNKKIEKIIPNENIKIVK